MIRLKVRLKVWVGIALEIGGGRFCGGPVEAQADSETKVCDCLSQARGSAHNAGDSLLPSPRRSGPIILAKPLFLHRRPSSPSSRARP